MKNYSGELSAYEHIQQLEQHKVLPPEFITQLKVFSGDLSLQIQKYKTLHNFVNIGVLLFLISCELLSFLFLNSFAETSWAWLIFTLLHGFTMYSLMIFTLHEGAAHKRIFIGQSPFIRFLQKIAHTLPRLYFADPDYYTSQHGDHHKYLGTKEDGAFTQYVWPTRILKSFLPLAAFLPFNDFRIHCGMQMSLRKLIWDILAVVFWIGLIFIFLPHVSFFLSLFLVFILGPWFSFALDRLRETSEHSLLPFEKISSARNLGFSVGGLIVGGGPWGQCFHLSHHISPQLPWYLQIFFGYRTWQMMNVEQRKTYFAYGSFVIFYIRQIIQIKKFQPSQLQLGTAYRQE